MGPDGGWATNRYYNTDMYANLAVDVIAKHARENRNRAAATQQPLFLYMAFQNSHAPYQCPTKYTTDVYPNLPVNGSQWCFNGMVTAMDNSVGKIVDALKTNGLYENTIIVYSSDNGGPASMANNLPLRGAKFGVFEGSFRVPAFVHSPLLPPAVVGKSSDATIFMSDWYVTFAKLAGVDPELVHNKSGPVVPDGMDIWDAVLGAGESPPLPSPRTMIVHEFDQQQKIYAIRDGDWKLIWGKIGDTTWIPDVSQFGKCSTLLPPRAAEEGDVPTAADVGATGTASASASASASAGDEGKEQRSESKVVVCTATSPCLFNVIKDPTEHVSGLATAAANPDIVQRLNKTLYDYVAHRYTGGLDVAKTSEEVYCEFVKRERWLRPYDDLPHPPTPPPTLPPPLPAASVKRLTGTWAQHWGESGKADEWIAVAVEQATAQITATIVNCSNCCWSTATGAVTAPPSKTGARTHAAGSTRIRIRMSSGEQLETFGLSTVVTPTHSCVKREIGIVVEATSSQHWPLGLAIEFRSGAAEAWSTWVKVKE